MDSLRHDRFRRTEDLLLLALHAAQLGAWENDLTTGENYWPAGMASLMGVPAERAEIESKRFLDYIHPDDRERVAALMDEVRRAAQPGRMFDADFRVIRPDGATRWFNSRGMEIETTDGHRRVVGVAQDITGRKANERRVQENEAALNEADRRKNEFLATLAHELRNPLAPIRNAAQILKQPALGESRRHTAVHILERQVRHMVRLVDDLLDVGRITSGKLHLVRERVELAAVIEHSIEASRPFEGHHFSVSLPRHPVYVDGDPVRLAQVFSNLLGNAVKYTPKGHAIGLVGEESGAQIVVKVSDEGIGIDPAEIGRLFDMFAQVESPLHRLHGGLGVGLALARVFVDKHGGSIEVHSDGRGKGTQFTVRLPIATGTVASRGP